MRKFIVTIPDASNYRAADIQALLGTDIAGVRVVDAPPMRSEPLPPKTIRLQAQDSLRNRYYLVITPERIYLTNPSQTPLAMSNIFTDAARVEFKLADCRGDVEACIRIAEAASNMAWGEVV